MKNTKIFLTVMLALVAYDLIKDDVSVFVQGSGNSIIGVIYDTLRGQDK